MTASFPGQLARSSMVCGRACGPVQVMPAGPYSILRFRLPSGYRLGRHVHDLSGFVLCLEGEYCARLSGREYRLTPGDFMVLGAGVEHEEYAAVATHCLIVTADPDRGSLPKGLSQRLSGFALTERCVDFSWLYRLWLELLVDDDLSRAEAAGASAAIARNWLVADVSARRPAPGWLYRAERRLRRCHAERNVVLNTAIELGVTSEHLVRTFHRRFGMTPGQFVRARRMLTALHALHESNAPIARIAQDAGFADQSHFTRMFRAMLRTTPDRYRRSLVSGG